MITLTNILNETSRAVLKVIQGPLAGFSVLKLARAHAINVGPIFFPRGASPPERSEERRKNGARTGLGARGTRAPPLPPPNIFKIIKSW